MKKEIEIQRIRKRYLKEIVCRGLGKKRRLVLEMCGNMPSSQSAESLRRRLFITDFYN